LTDVYFSGTSHDEKAEKPTSCSKMKWYAGNAYRTMERLARFSALRVSMNWKMREYGSYFSNCLHCKDLRPEECPFRNIVWNPAGGWGGPGTPSSKYRSVYLLNEGYSSPRFFILLTGHSILAHSRSSTSEVFCLIIIEYTVSNICKRNPLEYYALSMRKEIYDKRLTFYHVSQ